MRISAAGAGAFGLGRSIECRIEQHSPVLPSAAWWRRWRWADLVIPGILAATAAAMMVEGRIWWCECGDPRPWITDVWTSHCSQHLADPYSITHVSHGLILHFVMAWLRPRWAVRTRLWIVLGVAAAWEVLENSPPVIERYRTATMSLDYMGDSILNAIGDTVSCGIGFFVARRLGLLWTAAVFVASELILLILMRDNLILNVVMLIYPIPAIKEWQSVGHM